MIALALLWQRNQADFAATVNSPLTEICRKIARPGRTGQTVLTSTHYSMLNLTALKKVLSAVLSPPRLHTAILFTPSGDLIAHSTHANERTKDQLRVLVGLATEVWLEIGDDSVGMAESELGKIFVLPLQTSLARHGRSSSRSRSTDSTAATQSISEGEPQFLIVLNALDEAEWAEMQIKAQGAVNHLAGPLTEYKGSLPPFPPRTRIPERLY